MVSRVFRCWPVLPPHSGAHCSVLILVTTDSLNCHSIEFALALPRDFAAALLELLQDVTGNLAGALAKGVRARAAALLPAVDLPEGADADAAPDVDLPDHGGGAGVDPVCVVRRQLFVDA